MLILSHKIYEKVVIVDISEGSHRHRSAVETSVLIILQSPLNLPQILYGGARTIAKAIEINQNGGCFGAAVGRGLESSSPGWAGHVELAGVGEVVCRS